MTAWRWLPLALALGACGTPQPEFYQGYAEGEYVRVAAPYAGRLIALKVRRGNEVAAGAPLFELEQENEAAGKRELEARLKRAEAQLEDLTKGRRAPEVQAARSQLVQAEASLKLSEVRLRRAQQLAEGGAVSKQELDETRASYQRDRAHVSELSARLKTTRLPAREDEVLAQRAEIDASRAALAQAHWRLDQKKPVAPFAAPVNDTFYTEGEWVPAGSPVVSLLPPQNIKVRFFVPETALAKFRLGQEVHLTCDGCKTGMTAKVSFISPQAEFTPPVIYSKDARAKLVFLLEAKPDEPASLHPGQPVEVRP
ncbi:MAG: HlyD family efflux transporter periplasmic adaptor subunit [Burkholderiales bacterium]|nr:HlyD family efflux transporter periplasmic adaptor subunit [Burkholderiales bacterium]